MNEDEGWAAIDAQRLRVMALLESLTDDEWRRPSLCDGWTVRDVAAHLTLQQITIGQGLRALLRHRTGVTRLTLEMARDRAKLPTGDLVAGIRAMVGSRRHNVGVTFRETLIDITVHGLDIAVPLDRPLETDPAATRAVADRVWRLGWPFHARKRLAGYRIAASDVDWTVGDGAEVRGPIDAVVLLLTGRPAGLARLTGDGVSTLRRR
ncbi:maleylpyruvate isomerase family mycothiol-dependent enzyme [Virgisporangium aurantiacum]|uniref:Mycothiol-dependent maleylpyruvate isomerase metal-binding domain-containing protein n=1 Tax=Virgisporangium aurantiacum TaxID=175570 RepID=A0A8J4DYZ1_9ACTN|nr:maleylpyruvate isomerase family mycothiol-dependent enzyme [Virgisporangium aurantiacum]GIJ55434.1 hypothetical protein Vau01_029500 [Virgisporangium aurantiacum]